MNPVEPSPRDTLWRLTNAYQLSQALHVAATLGIADLLSEGSRSADDLAEAAGAHAPSLYRLLRVLASVGVFAEGDDGRFALTPPGEFLRSDVPGSARSWAMMIGQPYTWDAWSGLLQSVRDGTPAFPKLHGTSVWEYRAAHPEEGQIFDAAMNGLAAPAATAVICGYDFSGIGVLADIGGGQGELLAGILAANRGMRGILFDQPHVVAGAPAVLQRAGVAERCTVVEGDFFDLVPGDADAYVLKSVLHDWDDAAAVSILRQCRAAMPTHARLLLVEYVIHPGNEPDPAKLRDLMMLVMVGGRERTLADWDALYVEAGFRRTGVMPVGPYHIVEGTPC